ncbi:diguanylate cyclase [Halarcobacter sp.]|uniref:diguanylate cyclase n=1 Tax=Halarcobacter sp. TaxID=2321133 RepID=UPI002AABAD89|nr:diguanylate cyclase [Halarcobacter sp.]
MIPTVYDISITNVVSIEIEKTLDEAVDKLSKANLRTIVVENKKQNCFHILTTRELLQFKIENINKDTPLYKLNIPKAKALDKNMNLLTVLNYIDFSDEYMVITHKDELLGIVSYTDIVNNIDPQLIMEKQTISSLIHQYKAITTNENSSTFEAISLLKDNSTTDAILVLDKEYKPKGIFTTKDFIDVIRYDYDLSKPIKDYMTSPVDTLYDDTTISNAINFIKKKHYKRIVVVNKDGKISGVITQKELLRTFYNKWIELIKEEGSKISKTNEHLMQITSELETKVALDHLTKLYNRKKFDELLDKNIEEFSNLKDETFCMLILDIDDFKLLNDNHGHLFGDEVLKDIAKILTTKSRASDIVARWGGEEFVIILPKTNLEHATFFAEKIRQTIENFDFKKINKVSCSLGLAQFHNSDNKIELFKRADDALYRAKSLGKNRVELEHL